MAKFNLQPGPTTLSGAHLLSCALDENCATLDCDAVLNEYDVALMETPEGAEFVAYFCGLDYLERLPPATDDE